MPPVPIESPSLTPTVLKRSPTSPEADTPSLICAASRSRCMLQVLPSYHMLQMPTCGFCKSASVKPTPYSIACDAPWLRGCVTREEYLFTTAYRLTAFCLLPTAYYEVTPWLVVEVARDRGTASYCAT